MGKSRKTIYLIRHGRTGFNALGKYMGCGIDEDLSPEGISQIEEKREGIRRVTSGSVVFTGPLLRARNTAGLIYYDTDVTVEDTLTEIDFGDFEGKNYDELKDSEAYQKWIDSEGTSCFPNGEKREDFIERSYEGFLQAIRNSGDFNKVAIVCHGGNIMSVMSRLTGKEYYDFMAGNLEGYLLRFKFENERITDLSYNRINSGRHS